MNKTIKNVIVVVSISCLSLLIGLQLTTNDGPSDLITNTLTTSLDETTNTSHRPTLNEVASSEVLGYDSKLGPLPNSLDGTIMTNALVVDEAGNLRISNDIRRIFDYFLSTATEEPLDTIYARINEYLTHHLEQPALNQAKAILAGYIDLKKALYDFEIERSALMTQELENAQLAGNTENKLSLLEAQLQARNELRAQYLSQEVYEAFYADEQIFDQYTLDRMKVASNQALSENEKQMLLENIDNEAPEALVQARQETQISDTLKNRTAALRKQGASENDIRRLRAEMFGEEAAVRFEALDKERAEWKRRLSQYLAERNEILSSEGISIEDRQSQIDALRANEFDERERIRVKVFERQADT